jgi:type II secretory pathway component PulF
MSKMSVRLKLKDMYAIKHALENIVERKELCLAMVNLTENHGKTNEEIERLRKDVEHEERLIKQFETEISNFEEYIGR